MATLFLKCHASLQREAICSNCREKFIGVFHAS